MKPIVISSCFALACVSLYAADPQATKDITTPIQLTHPAKVFSSPQASATGDSPLVRAAKSTNRLTRKPSSQVITNETLVHEGGHFTTTTDAQKLPAVNPTTGPSMDQMAADAQRGRIEAAAAAAQAKRVEEQKKYAAGYANALREGDTPEALFDVQPNINPTPIQPMKPISPTDMSQQQKPPQ
jgi:hypothetical protein